MVKAKKKTLKLKEASLIKKITNQIIIKLIVDTKIYEIVSIVFNELVFFLIKKLLNILLKFRTSLTT